MQVRSDLLMIKKKYITLISVLIFLLLVNTRLLSQENTEENESDQQPAVLIKEGDEPFYPMGYEEGDWEEYIWQGLRSQEYNTKKPKEHFIAQGLLQYRFGLGRSWFVKDSYQYSDISEPKSKVLKDGISQERTVLLHMEGDVNDRVRVYIHHDSTSEDAMNYYLVEYHAIEDDEVLREAHIGNIKVNVDNSKYAVYDSGTRMALGFDSTFQKDKLKVKAFGSVFQSESEVETFIGNEQKDSTSLKEYQFIKLKYYQLEPFKRYDGLTQSPNISSAGNSYTSLVTFTSQLPSDDDYTLTPVNIASGSVSIYYDDQVGSNNTNGITLATDGGYYNKLSSGTDYTINYTTGVITFKKSISDESRIFVLYSLKNGPSSDPAVRTDLFSGKNFVFIKYGEQLDEDSDRNYTGNSDTNGDGKTNYDIYEKKGVYTIGSSGMSEENFKLTIVSNNAEILESEKSLLGTFKIDYDNGLISYILPRPFTALLPTKSAARIYNQNQPDDVYRYSSYSLYFNYTAKERTYQLKHINILENTVSVKVDGKEIKSSLYEVDGDEGTLEFTDPNSPYIGPKTEVEIRYEYGELGNTSTYFMGGFRTDYYVNRNLSLGGTLLYSASPMATSIPDIGDEPESNLVLESDASVYLGPAKLKKLASRITGKQVRNAPFDVNGYFEVAHSHLDVNTFGKAMIDDMESSDEIVGISLSEKEWILAALPQGYDQSERGKLYYKYYRSLSDLDTLKDESFTPHEIDYSVKPGPYNIAESHLEETADQDGYSLVLDFDLETDDSCSSITTRNLSSDSVDFSSLQYAEIWYRSAGGSGTVSLSLDVGTINEDSDGDGKLDTEDTNSNGYLDYDSSNFEDRGYLFNPDGEESTRVGGGPRLSSNTKGDGKLTSEDTNSNGTLDQNENMVSFPGTGSGFASYLNGQSGSTQLNVQLGDTGWKKAVIYLDRSNSALSTTASDILGNTQAIRLNVQSNSAVEGTIYISSIKFISSAWQDIEINGVKNEETENFRVSLVDSYNDTEYNGSSFLREQPTDYRELYGDNSLDDDGSPQEGALQVCYDSLSGGTGSATHSFSKSIDLSKYGSLAFWLNVREFTTGDILRLYVGSGDDDYLVYEEELIKKDVWQKLKFDLDDDDNNVTITGSPDLMHISFMKVEIEGNEGKLWVNNIYAANPEDLTDVAYWSEGEIKSRRPVYVGKDTRYYGDNFSMKYVKRGVGRDFVSPGRTVRDMSEDAHEFYSSIDITPELKTDLSVIRELTRTSSVNEDVDEELWGKTIKRSSVLNTTYTSPYIFVPNVIMKQQYTRYDNWHEETITEELYEDETDRDEYAPSLVLEKEVNHFLFGDLYTRLSSDLLFSTQKERWTADNDEDAISIDRQRERYQTDDTSFGVHYTNKFFYIHPDFNTYSGDFVEYKGYDSETGTTIKSELDGDFQLPYFSSGDNFKLFERGRKIELTSGLTPIKLINLDYSGIVSYDEYTFTDYNENNDLVDIGYEREKDADTVVSNTVKIPFNFSRKKSEFLRNITVGYGRRIELNESAVPYEGESEEYLNENYGIKHSFGGIQESAYNMASYPPWYFFLGRSNFANGRDQVYETMNDSLTIDGQQVEDYTNALLIKDEYTLSSFANFVPLSLSFNASLSQLSQRAEVEEVSSQLVQYSAGTDIFFDLMEIFSFGFFRHNSPSRSRHFAQISTGYTFSRNMIITSNIQEDNHIPSLGTTFGINRKAITLKGSIDFIHRTDHEYIILDEDERPSADDKYYDNLSLEDFKEDDRSYSFYAEYQTDIPFIYNFFGRFYRLIDYPMFLISYELLLNRYDYENSVSPEPYDMHLVTNSINIDVHKNLQGNIDLEWAFERFRSRDTGDIYSEVLTIELNFGLTLIF